MASSATKTYVHIGFPKTASTWLQKNVFSDTEYFRYFSLQHSKENIDASFYSWIKAARFCDDLSAKKVFSGKQNFMDWIEQQRTIQDSRPVLVSDEGLCNGAFRVSSCNRIYEAFPDAHIIVFVRNQIDILYSKYLQYSRGFGSKTYSCSFNEYIEKIIKDRNIGQPSLTVSCHGHYEHITPQNVLFYLDYNELIELYEQKFGQDKVHVFLYESLFDPQEDTLQRLSDLLGYDYEKIKEKTSTKTHSRVSKSQYMNKVCLGSFNPVNRLLSFYWKALSFAEKKGLTCTKPLELKMTPEQEKFIRSLFAEGNTKLAERYKLNIEKYDYPMNGVKKDNPDL